MGRVTEFYDLVGYVRGRRKESSGGKDVGINWEGGIPEGKRAWGAGSRAQLETSQVWGAWDSPEICV